MDSYAAITEARLAKAEDHGNMRVQMAKHIENISEGIVKMLREVRARTTGNQELMTDEYIRLLHDAAIDIGAIMLTGRSQAERRKLISLWDTSRDGKLSTDELHAGISHIIRMMNGLHDDMAKLEEHGYEMSLVTEFITEIVAWCFGQLSF